MSVERRLPSETLIRVPFLGITLVHVVWVMIHFYFGIYDWLFPSHATYLMFADLVFSGVKSLSRIFTIILYGMFNILYYLQYPLLYCLYS